MSALDSRVHLYRAQLDEQRRDGWRAADATQRMRVAARRGLDELAQSLGRAPSDWPKHADGSPAPMDGLHWSVSHSRGFVAAAICAAQPIGLDLESRQRPRPLHAGERLVQLGLPRELLESKDAWLAAWCRMEAVAKLTGLGLAALAKIQIRPTDRNLGDRGDSDVEIQLHGQPVPTRVLLDDHTVCAVAWSSGPAPTIHPFRAARTHASPPA